MLFSTDLGCKDLILQALKEEFMEDEDSCPPIQSSVLTTFIRSGLRETSIIFRKAPAN